MNNVFSFFSRKGTCCPIKMDHCLVFPEKLAESLRKRDEKMEDICECFFWVFCEDFDESLFDLFEILARQCKREFDSILWGDLSIGE